MTSITKTLIDTLIFKNFISIPLETNDKNFLQEISRVTINNGRIYVFDDRLDKICIFDDKGKYINQIHSIGEGPKEYLAIIDFCLDEKNNEVLLLCDRPYKWMRFSLDGDFIDETTFSDLYMEMSIDSDHLFCLLDENTDEYEIGCFNQNFQFIYKGLASRDNINKECHSRGKSLVKSNNLNYTRRFDPSIYHLSKDRIEKKYEFDFGEHRFPIDLSYEKDCSKFFERCRAGKYIYSITNAVESDKYIIFNTNIGICLYEKETNKLNGYEILLNQSLRSGSNVFFQMKEMEIQS
ncbi:hypothetical protein EZS27_035441 [termite gut metagenome]|uniref:6-bladed beta-propeller n=1 Tax=termite gut metagenome TaxID=433724 RepID=A0A5J4PXR3_9ZZZZ